MCALELPFFAGQHDENDADEEWFGEVIFAVQDGMLAFVAGCDAHPSALHSLENGLRVLGKVGLQRCAALQMQIRHQHDRKRLHCHYVSPSASLAGAQPYQRSHSQP